MDSNTFTCPACERTLPIEDLADSSGSASLCFDCHGADGDSAVHTSDGATDPSSPHAEPPTEPPAESSPPTESARPPAESPRPSAGSHRSPDESAREDRSAPDDESTPPDTRAEAAGQTGDDRFWEADPDVGLRDATRTTTPLSEETPDSRDDSLDRKIDGWKEQLLDLTRRNTLVDFTETKTKSLPLAGVTPPTVAASLRDDALTIRKRDDETDPEGVSLRGGEVLATRAPEATAESLYRIGLNEKQFLRERGVDTLYLVLGSLRWRTPDEPEDPYHSPLFLTPVDLDQRPVEGGHLHNYAIEPEGDDLLVNPALRKKLSAEFNLELPPDEALGLECIDAAFQAVHEDVSGFADWVLDDDVILGVFDFAKYSLYTDLEQNRDAIRDDPLVRALDDDTAALRETEADADVVGVDELDDRVDPRGVYQVLDADSSQQAAIEAAKSGRSIVIQGPPGTGKSQTIANIVAEKLAADETVLFVSEKQAALNVVKDRLDDVGLGRFCLEAHGRRASKSTVLESLEAELQATPVKDAPDRGEALDRLVRRRETLNSYGETLLEPPEGFAVSPYEAFGVVADTEDVPDVEIGLDDPLALDQATLDAARDGLEALARFDTEIETSDSHPWRHTTVTRWRVGTAARVEDTVDAHESAIADLAAAADEIDDRLGVTASSCTEVERAVELLAHLRARPEVDWEPRHVSEEFLALGDRLDAFATHMERVEELRSGLLADYRESVLDADGRALHAAASRYGVFRFLRPGYYTVRNRIRGHAREAYEPSFGDLLEDTRRLMELQRLEAEVEEYPDVQAALGPLYRGRATDWDRLRTIQGWVTELLAFPFECSGIVEDLLEDDLPDVEGLQETAGAALARFHETDDDLREILDVEAVTVEGAGLHDADFAAARAHLAALAGSVDELEAWVEFQQHLADLGDTIAAEYVERFLAGDHDAADLLPAFEKRFFTRWLNECYDETVLGDFNADTFGRYLADFRRLDEEQQELAKVAVQHLVTARRPQLDLEHADSSEQVILRREIQKQRQHKPLRELFDEAGEFITKLKPCFMMSPLSVAQYLRRDSIAFDTVIFDEASQVRPEDAISSIIRADQVLIAGDTKQLPPTTFFDTDVDPGAGVRRDLDSILAEAAAVLPEVQLTWHYRSRSANLIEFSNQLYYNGRLQTFPENDPGTDTGVEFVHVEDGVYDRGGTRRNDVEAARVAELVAEHAATRPDKSLGVVAFSVAQEEAVREALEARRADDEALDRFIDEDDILGEFFVKNLEMVQGDERDRMLFSVGYGPDAEGDISMNFGPLNQQGGERRLNVAITRARERVTVVSSLRPAEIDLSRTASTGVEHFKRYLEYARDQGEVLTTAGAGAEADLETPLQRSVYDALTARGYEVDVVESSGYSLDLAIGDGADAAAHQVGLEIDASAYQWSNTARDRDRIRPAVLEDLGWTVHRIWAPDWVTNRERVLDRLEAALDGASEGGPGEPNDADALEVATYEPEEYSRAELDAARDGVGTYRSPEPDTKRDVRFEEAAPDTIHRALYSLVLEHGPIHRDEAFRAVATAFGEPRRTPTVEESLDIHLLSLKNEGRLVEAEGFLWPQRQDLSFAVRRNGEASRSIDRIPLEEVALAVTLVLDAGFSMTRPDLVVETARLFGYERVGDRIDRRVNRAIDRLQEDGFVAGDDRLSLEADAGTVEDALLGDVYG